MKPLFVCLVLSVLLTLGVNATAQNAQQIGATAAKTSIKPAATAATPPQATPAVASKPTPAKAKKAVKSSEKAAKGLFKNDFDGEVGIKYIGTDPLPDEEVGKVKDSKRTDTPTKKARKAKPVTSKKVSEAKTEVEVEAVKPDAVKSTPAAATAKADAVKSDAVKSTPAAVIAKIEEVKTEVKPAKLEVIKPAAATDVTPKAMPVKAVKTTPKIVEKPKLPTEIAKMPTEIAKKAESRG